MQSTLTVRMALSLESTNPIQTGDHRQRGNFGFCVCMHSISKFEKTYLEIHFHPFPLLLSAQLQKSAQEDLVTAISFIVILRVLIKIHFYQIVFFDSGTPIIIILYVNKKDAIRIDARGQPEVCWAWFSRTKAPHRPAEHAHPVGDSSILDAVVLLRGTKSQSGHRHG